MNFRLLQTLGQIGQKGSGASARAATMPLVKPAGSLRMKHFELSEFDALEVEADVDILWTPGASKARLRMRENIAKHLRVELIERTLRITATCDIDGERPTVVLSSSELLHIHVGAACSAEIQDLKSGVLIASAFDKAWLRMQGHARELHVECKGEAVIDCASLVCDIAIADLSGDSVTLLRAESALQADTRDGSHLLTIGSPRILDVTRHPSGFSLQTFANRKPAPLDF